MKMFRVFSSPFFTHRRLWKFWTVFACRWFPWRSFSWRRRWRSYAKYVSA